MKTPSQITATPVANRTAYRIKKIDNVKKWRCLHASLVAIMENFPVRNLYRDKLAKLRAPTNDNSSSNRLM